MSKQTISTLFFLAATAAFSFGAHAAQTGSIRISSPADGATIDGHARNDVIFSAHPSGDGNHLHFYVDNGRPAMVHEWKGHFTLPVLSAGKHEICVKEATANHTLTGLQKCITVNAR